MYAASVLVLESCMHETPPLSISAKALLIVIPELICWPELRCVTADCQRRVGACVGHSS
jgi:hypothetical protein